MALVLSCWRKGDLHHSRKLWLAGLVVGGGFCIYCAGYLSLFTLKDDLRTLWAATFMPLDPGSFYFYQWLYYSFIKLFKNPVGMYGNILSASMHAITTSSSNVINLTNCLALCHLNVEGYVSSAYASGIACLSDEDRELGAELSRFLISLRTPATNPSAPSHARTGVSSPTITPAIVG